MTYTKNNVNLALSKFQINSSNETKYAIASAGVGKNVEETLSESYYRNYTRSELR